MGRAPFRRIGAYLIDSLPIAVLIASLALLNDAGAAFAESSGAGDLGVQARAHLRGFLALTLPVLAYFTLFEASPLTGTPGKRLLGLKVQRTEGGAPGFRRVLVRNVVKFLPWEINHAAMWYVPEGHRLFLDTPPAANLAIQIGAMVVAGFYILSLFSGTGRTPYDRISGTKVSR